MSFEVNEPKINEGLQELMKKKINYVKNNLERHLSELKELKKEHPSKFNHELEFVGAVVSVQNNEYNKIKNFVEGNILTESYDKIFHELVKDYRENIKRLIK